MSDEFAQLCTARSGGRCAIVSIANLFLCTFSFPHRSCSAARHKTIQLSLNDDDPMIICQFVTIELRFYFVVALFFGCVLSQIKFLNLNKSISNLYFIRVSISLLIFNSIPATWILFYFIFHAVYSAIVLSSRCAVCCLSRGNWKKGAIM